MLITFKYIEHTIRQVNKTNPIYHIAYLKNKYIPIINNVLWLLNIIPQIVFLIIWIKILYYQKHEYIIDIKAINISNQSSYVLGMGVKFD